MQQSPCIISLATLGTRTKKRQDNIKTDVKEQRMELLKMAQDMIQLQALVNTVTNLRVQ
jgi:hypothetical protein